MTPKKPPHEIPPNPPDQRAGRFRWLHWLGRGAVVVILTIGMAWATAAVWFDGPTQRWLAGAIATAIPLVCAAAAWRLRRFWPTVGVCTGLFVLVLIWWLSLAPRNDRDWQPDVARVATAEFSGNQVTIHNVRNFLYRSNDDFTPRWETRTYDLSQVRAFDLFLSFWGPTMIAHTVASWEFSDGRHLAISIETRKEKGEEYSAVRGFFRQFETYYVVADEQDVIGLRASHRGERVFLYRFRIDPAIARAVLNDYLLMLNELSVQPRWYNALTSNCTTAIRSHFARILPLRRPSWKLLLNGYLDELLYNRGLIDSSLPLSEIRLRSDVTERAKAAAGDPAFSTRLRATTPPAPHP